MSDMVNRRQVLRGLGAGAAVGFSGRGFGFAPAEAEGQPEATTSHGRVSGSLVEGVHVFKGIPYGADTSTTRFQAPRPPVPWTVTKACTQWGPRAPQQTRDRKQPGPVSAGFRALEDAANDAPVHYHLQPDEGPQSEDCLHLNVWTPGLRDQRHRPVLFYIHGGAYNNGTVNAALYDGSRLARYGDAVVVTVNHRINAFGYMYLPTLGPDYAPAGNAGMLDLVLALEWVRHNISEFGGDPHRVTIFGQSGGGAKCATLMAMPAAHGLFHRVWTMSGQQVWAAPPDKAAVNADNALRATGITGAATTAQLNALTLEQIRAGAQTTNNWLPVNDDVVLHRGPFDPDAPPISNAVPMVLGNTKDEIYGATAWQRSNLTWDTLDGPLRKAIAEFKGRYKVPEIVAAYRSRYPAYTPNDVFTAALAAFRSWPGQVIEAERRASHPVSAARTWVYQMDYPSPTADGRAPHTLDIAFVFDNLVLSPGMVGSSAEDVAAAQPLAGVMSKRLLAFARTGIPGPAWPVYDLKERRTMLFDRRSEVVSNPRGKEREMMVNAHYRQPGT